jgi:hypothetical protein
MKVSPSTRTPPVLVRLVLSNKTRSQAVLSRQLPTMTIDSLEELLDGCTSPSAPRLSVDDDEWQRTLERRATEVPS